MNPGKIPADLLRRIVYPHLPTHPGVLVAAQVGEDCTVLDFGPSVCVATCDPITGAQRYLGRLAVHVACNDLAATGAEPVALLMTVLLPDGAGEDALASLMREAGETARAVGVAIAGGHSEVTSRVNAPVAVVTAIGRAPRSGFVTAAGGRPGDTLLLTKAAGLEGTAILALDRATDLMGRVSEEILSRAAAFLDEISVLPEGRIAIAAGATAMHDVTEGGVLGAVWELAEASRLGVQVFADAIPVRPETAAICEALGLDPLSLIGSGALIVATPEPDRAREALTGADIPVSMIGRLTAPGSRIVRRGGEDRLLVAPSSDELWRALDGPTAPG